MLQLLDAARGLARVHEASRKVSRGIARPRTTDRLIDKAARWELGLVSGRNMSLLAPLGARARWCIGVPPRLRGQAGAACRPHALAEGECFGSLLRSTEEGEGFEQRGQPSGAATRAAQRSEGQLTKIHGVREPLAGRRGSRRGLHRTARPSLAIVGTELRELTAWATAACLGLLLAYREPLRRQRPKERAEPKGSRPRRGAPESPRLPSALGTAASPIGGRPRAR